jgi:hypothetical protein
MLDAEKPLVKNAADREQVKEAGSKKQLQKKQKQADLKFVLETAQGKRFLWGLLKKCGIFETSYDSNPHTVYFKEGRRNLGLELIAEINDASPEALEAMMTESKKFVG